MYSFSAFHQAITHNKTYFGLSHRSFNSSLLSKEWELKPIRYEGLAIFVSGDKSVWESDYTVVLLTLRNKEDSLSYFLKALVSEYITNFSSKVPDVLTRVPEKENDLKFADCLQ